MHQIVINIKKTSQNGKEKNQKNISEQEDGNCSESRRNGKSARWMDNEL